jgi:hypothetical protein
MPRRGATGSLKRSQTHKASDGGVRIAMTQWRAPAVIEIANVALYNAAA